MFQSAEHAQDFSICTSAEELCPAHPLLNLFS